MSNLYVKAGGAADPAEKIGLAEMAAELLTQGTESRSAREIAETIEGVGGDLSASAGLDYLTVSSTVLADQLPLAFDLVSDVALHPTFPTEELEIARKRTLTGLQVELSQPGPIAERRFIREIYGPGNPYGFSTLPATIEAIDRADLEGFHDTNFRADNALLVVSGDVDPRARRAARPRSTSATGTAVSDPPSPSRSPPRLGRRR